MLLFLYFSLFWIQTSDSLRYFLIKITITAGIIEIKNVNLQPIIGLNIPPTNEAKITPIGIYQPKDSTDKNITFHIEK